jgi:hypothetical protein
MAWRALCAAAAALMFGGVGCDWQPPGIAELIPTPALVELTVRKLPRCTHCGWIEAKRLIAPLGAPEPLSYEYTVRMGDGSSHVFREDMPVSWRLGERLIYIKGAVPLN